MSTIMHRYGSSRRVSQLPEVAADESALGEQLHRRLDGQLQSLLPLFNRVVEGLQSNITRRTTVIELDENANYVLRYTPSHPACRACKLSLAPQQQCQCITGSRALCGDPQPTAISDLVSPTGRFLRPAQSSASQSYSSQLIYLWRFRDNSMTAHLIEDWTPPLAHRVGGWKAALPTMITFGKPWHQSVV